MSSLEVEGIDSLLARLQSMGQAGNRIANRALKKAAEPLQKSMSEHVNVSRYNDVHLRDDIEVSRVKTDATGQKYIEVGPGKRTAWRAKFLEFGTSKMTARPFMAPALKETKGEVMNAIASTLRAGLSK